MDRIISLLAALVGLIALGGAVLVHVNTDARQQQIETELAAVKAATAAIVVPAPAAAPAPAEDERTTEALLALKNRVATLEQMTTDQADALDAAKTQLAALASAPPAQTAVASASAEPAPSSTPAAVVADGPTTDCIPLGTRFMGQSGDSFPICKTKAVVKVASVADGSAIIEGAGPISAGGFGNLTTQGCTVMVFSADTSGYAEMRVTCQ